MNPAWLFLIVPVLLFAGFQIGSIVENKKGYNFADLEDDLLKSLYAQATAEGQAAAQKGKSVVTGVSAAEKSVIARIAKGARKLEFWKKTTP